MLETLKIGSEKVKITVDTSWNGPKVTETDKKAYLEAAKDRVTDALGALSDEERSVVFPASAEVTLSSNADENTCHTRISCANPGTLYLAISDEVSNILPPKTEIIAARTEGAYENWKGKAVLTIDEYETARVTKVQLFNSKRDTNPSLTIEVDEFGAISFTPNLQQNFPSLLQEEYIKELSRSQEGRQKIFDALRYYIFTGKMKKIKAL